MAQVTAKDEELIALLKVDAREPVAALARKLGLSRTTVQDRLRRLEETGVIARDAVGGTAAAG
jgi:DNA-binding Lrp family transcriptional regulator